MTNRPLKSRGPLSRREFLRLSGLGLGAAALAACQPAVPATEAAPATEAPMSGGLSFKGTLDVWDWEYPVREALIKEYVEEWKSLYPDIPINYLVLPWADIETKILAVGTAGNSPAVSDVFGFWRYDLQRANAITPFPNDFTDWDDRISTPFMQDENGAVRALPSGWFMDMIYYNKDIFEKEGLKPADIPVKWDDFIKFADQLTQRDPDGKVTRAGCAMNDYWQHEYLWQDLIYQQEGWMYNEDGTQAIWEDEPSVAALQFIQDWYNKHKIDSRELPEGYGGFCNDLSVMFMGSGWNTGFFMNDFPQMEGRWDTVPLPTFTGTMSPAVGIATAEENFQVFASHPSEVQQAGFAFIKHVMVGDDRVARWTKAQASCPDSRKALSAESTMAITGIKAQADTLPYRVCYGERPIEAEKLWRTMFDKVILENGDVKAALKEANDAINQVLSTKKRFITERRYKTPA